MSGFLTNRVLIISWLALVWLLLWGTPNPLALVSAAVVAPACWAACRLPWRPIEVRPRWRLLPGAVLRFLRDLVASSVEVAWTVVRRGPRTRSAVLALTVPCSSEVVLATIADRLSLEPGTLVIDIDQANDTLYVYVLDVQPDGQESDIEQVRRKAQARAHDVLRALGVDEAAAEGRREENT